MRQIRITTKDLVLKEENDCVLSPDDPIHKMLHPLGLNLPFSSQLSEKFNTLTDPQDKDAK